LFVEEPTLYKTEVTGIICHAMKGERVILSLPAILLLRAAGLKR